MNRRQEAFAREFVKDFNATQAALRAGYSSRTSYAQGHRLLKHAEVGARIAELTQARAEAAEIDARWVLDKLLEVLEDPGLHPRDRLKALELVGKHCAVVAWRENLRLQVPELVVRDYTGMDLPPPKPNGQDRSVLEGRGDDGGGP